MNNVSTFYTFIKPLISSIKSQYNLITLCMHNNNAKYSTKTFFLTSYLLIRNLSYAIPLKIIFDGKLPWPGFPLI